MRKLFRIIVSTILVISFLCFPVNGQSEGLGSSLEWSNLPDLPDALGRAGVFVGVHNDALIIAGGTNFPQPVWESNKVWYGDIYVMTKNGEGFKWYEGFQLQRPLAYGGSVSTEYGIVCMGGNDAKRTYSDVFLLKWNAENKTVEQKKLPELPSPCAYTAATSIGDVIYVAGGISGLGLETAMTNFWSLDMSKADDTEVFEWQMLPGWPGASRGFNLTATQHNGKTDCVYVMSGRRMSDSRDGEVEFLTDVYEFNPTLCDARKYDAQRQVYDGDVNPWRQRQDVLQCVMAGTAIKVGQSHIFALGGADGSLWGKADVLKDDHPGFGKKSFAYHTITNTWVEAGALPANHVTTTAVRWGGDLVNDPIIIASGEVRPRVRSPKIWSVLPIKSKNTFGVIDFSMIGVYLALMIGVGVFFSFRNKNSDDFFRGGQRVTWFVAGLSIFATMLSSITFIAIPAKAFMTDWVYFLANMTAVLIAPFVIWLFLPFFRKIDATSAYEYLEKRFNRFVRLFASGSFIFFQIGRMAIVMYLPALALAAITPLTEVQCILMMGVLSIIYCTMGGLEAVVWTDTIQSFVLLGGALLCLVLIVFQVDGGFGGFVSAAATDSKFHIVNWDFSSISFATTAFWVVVLGGIGQSLVSYSSDMAVVQRYMSVPTLGHARRAIWTNAVAVIPASILFFGVGTALFVFYKDNPERLDPTFKNDAIFPLFIARELPVGIAGLVVAGVFAAAQSTISTSMNSTSTAFVTDFVRPFRIVKTEKGYLQLARIMTLTLGCLGTALAVLFASSDIKSLLDVFMKILGLLGGPMCGLFCLGIFTTRTNGTGAIIGALAGAGGLFFVQRYTDIHLLLYAFVGITFCFLCSYIVSAAFPGSRKSISGLTIHTLE